MLDKGSDGWRTKSGSAASIRFAISFGQGIANKVRPSLLTTTEAGQLVLEQATSLIVFRRDGVGVEASGSAAEQEQQTRSTANIQVDPVGDMCPLYGSVLSLGGVPENVQLRATCTEFMGGIMNELNSN
eukprot:797948-Prorocentrum_minimum.AAC.3